MLGARQGDMAREATLTQLEYAQRHGRREKSFFINKLNAFLRIFQESRPTLEFNNHYVANDWLLLDGDLAFSQARFDQLQGDPANLGR
jgi:hypothetical protein